MPEVVERIGHEPRHPLDRQGSSGFNVPIAFGAGSFPGGSERAPRALVEGHLWGRFVQSAKVSRAEAGLRARSVGERARESAWGPPNNELQLTAGPAVDGWSRCAAPPDGCLEQWLWTA